MDDPDAHFPGGGDRRLQSALSGVEHYAVALGLVGLSTLIGMWMAPRWGTAAVDMIYLPSVLAAAVLWGLGPALAAGVASTLAYNFFFTEPIHTFRITRVTDVVTVIVLLLVALVTSRLAAGIRNQAQLAASHAARNATIAGFARRLLSCSGEAEITATSCDELHNMFDCNAMVLGGLPQPNTLAEAPGGVRLTPSDIAAAVLAIESGEPAGRGTTRLQPAEWVFFPIRSASAVLGVAGLARDDGRPPIPEEARPLLTNLLDQLALALERARADAEVQDFESLRERDRLRSALLSSVGHDLRTPLTSIIGAAAELRQSGKADPLIETIESEAGKLERYITNLLDMARVESGAVKLRIEPIDLVDAIAAATRDVRGLLQDRDVEVAIARDLPLVRADPDLLHHCLLNLLDNAARYSPGNEPIVISADCVDDSVRLAITDRGPGLPKDRDRAFGAFDRLDGSDRKGGAGLGLAIVKAFADAMGVKVDASNRPEGAGTTFALTFPRDLLLTPADPANAV